ncbi:putative secondary metabolism biosynthetic enzyme [Arachnomyces sp. PD_36]|nr:putative secondary metabolism biosynthetic enzyme [Arachnomyces sp. PD_36]
MAEGVARVSGRRRFNCVTADQELKLGKQSYNQIMAEYRGRILPASHPYTQFVDRVMRRLIPFAEMGGGQGGMTTDWEVHVIKDDQMRNAFVLPGGKVFVFTGILPITEDEDGMAAILGHEIAHVVAHHAAERMSSSILAVVAVAATAILFDVSGNLSSMIFNLAFGLPNSRTQEAEADHIGLTMMAKGCYNPQAAVKLWGRMQQAEKGAPPEFLSTHPSSYNRMEAIRERLPAAEQTYSDSGCSETIGYDMSADVSGLSHRGNVAASPSRKMALLGVINNLWDPESNPDGFISLGIAENALMHKEMADYIHKSFNITDHALTYGDGFSGSKRLREAISAFVNRNFEPLHPTLPEQVTVTSGVTNAIEACAWGLGDHGDGFLLGRPYYGAFPSDLGTRAGVKAVGVSFGDVDPFGLGAVSKYEEALLRSRQEGVPVKALLLCSPHNPLGRCYPRDVLIELMKLCQKYHIHLISDEIYALSVFENSEAPDAPRFVSVLSIDTTDLIDPHLVHVLWGMSKDFGANGLRIGCVISQSNPHFLQALQTNAVFCYPASLSDHIAANVLEDQDFNTKYTKTNQLRLSENYHFTISFLKKHGIPYYPGSNAGFFVWVNLRPSFENSLSESMKDKLKLEGSKEVDSRKLSARIMEALMEKKIFLASGESFGTDEEGWFRVVFAHPKEYLSMGLQRMLDVVKQT